MELEAQAKEVSKGTILYNIPLNKYEILKHQTSISKGNLNHCKFIIVHDHIDVKYGNNF